MLQFQVLLGVISIVCLVGWMAVNPARRIIGTPVHILSIGWRARIWLARAAGVALVFGLGVAAIEPVLFPDVPPARAFELAKVFLDATPPILMLLWAGLDLFTESDALDPSFVGLPQSVVNSRRVKGQGGATYVLIKRLGGGGMGDVFLGQQANAKRKGRVAIKFLRLGAEDNAELAKRSAREYRALSKIDSPHVVKTLDVSEEIDVTFIVMKLVAGQNLSQLLSHRGTLPIEDVANIVHQAGLGVAASHAHGILHRDLKPSNLIVDPKTESMQTTVIDFGLVKFDEAQMSTALTDLSTGIVGTVAYLPPEFTRGQPATTQSDMYGLGTIAYEALTGSPPYTGEGATVIGDLWDAEKFPVNPRVLNSELTPEVALVLAKALDKNPAQRFKSGESLADALRAASKGNLSGQLRKDGERALATHPWSEAQ